jgi:hypothetical protein
MIEIHSPVVDKCGERVGGWRGVAMHSLKLNPTLQGFYACPARRVGGLQPSSALLDTP